MSDSETTISPAQEWLTTAVVRCCQPLERAQRQIPSVRSSLANAISELSVEDPSFDELREEIFRASDRLRVAEFAIDAAVRSVVRALKQSHL